MMDFESAAIRIGAEYVARCAEAVSKRAKEYCKNDTVRDAIEYQSDGLCTVVSANAPEALHEEFGGYAEPARAFLTPALSVIKEGLL